MIWSAAFSSISPGLVWPMDVRWASACERDGEIKRLRKAGREGGLEKDRKGRERKDVRKEEWRGIEEDGGGMEREGWGWVRKEEKGRMSEQEETEKRRRIKGKEQRKGRRKEFIPDLFIMRTRNRRGEEKDLSSWLIHHAYAPSVQGVSDQEPQSVRWVTPCK